MIARALEVATAAAHQAGQVVLSYYSTPYDIQDKSPDHPVTSADVDANRVLRDTLLGVFPDVGWLSEERVGYLCRNFAGHRSW